MKVLRDEKNGVFVLCPVSVKEKYVLKQLLTVVKPGQNFIYGGREADGEYCKVFLHYGSERKSVMKEIAPGITCLKSKIVGGIRLEIVGTTVDDKIETGRFRNVLYFGGGAPIFMGAIKVNDEDGFAISIRHCKLCESPMIKLAECEWSVCDSCAGKCQHKYELGMVHGGAAGSGAVAEFCIECGRGKPGSVDESKSSAEHHVEIEKELGIKWLYKDIPFTPAEVVELERAALTAQV